MFSRMIGRIVDRHAGPSRAEIVAQVARSVVRDAHASNLDVHEGRVIASSTSFRDGGEAAALLRDLRAGRAEDLAAALEEAFWPFSRLRAEQDGEGRFRVTAEVDFDRPRLTARDPAPAARPEDDGDDRRPGPWG